MVRQTDPIANPNRVFVTDPRQWGIALGTDYMFGTGTASALITGGTAGQVLSEYGWTTTALGYSTPTGADFISAADMATPAGILFDASNDRLSSPYIFGDFSHANAARAILGYLPTTLNFECIAAFTVNSANETTSGFGFVEAGGSPLVANDGLAMIVSDGTNFFIRSGAATSTAGAAVDTSFHKWNIVMNATNATFFIDDVAQTAVATETDLFPCAFGASVTTTNRITLSSPHIWYA